MTVKSIPGELSCVFSHEAGMRPEAVASAVFRVCRFVAAPTAADDGKQPQVPLHAERNRRRTSC
ncbi:MAG TPA: hypothetical protein O0Y06_01825 [Methanocorpusculum sp.]|nr:hypothetical protein [Methanocorpusculum sp.]HJK79621.1 hypothetical protein [Methanocorpusculum sp.]